MKGKKIFLVVVAVGLISGLIGCNENKEESISDKSIEINNEIKKTNTTEVYKSALENNTPVDENMKIGDEGLENGTEDINFIKPIPIPSKKIEIAPTLLQ